MSLRSTCTVTAFKPLLRRSGSFKVTDFCTNRKLIYDFLLVINTNLPPILHRFQVIADLVKFSLVTRGVLYYNALARLIPCQYCHKWYIAEIYILWHTFLSQNVPVYLQPLLCNRTEIYRIQWNYAAVRAITPFKVIRGHRVRYQWKDRMRLPISD